MFNSIDITGRIATNAQTTHPKDELSKTAFRLYALKEDADQKDEAAIPVIAFNGVGLQIQNRYAVGDLVRIQGRIRYSTWTDKASGQPRSEYQIIVNKARRLELGKASQKARAEIQELAEVASTTK
jgi:single-stranded DNA-binding protein